ncbi:MAG TPA: mitofilin family membrane protein [Acetobacteraceae bacterium]|nr:mitofilin family membrane protein [Acetobacteraceae bacterium]
MLSAIGFLLLLAGGVWLYEREEALFAAQAEIDPGRLSAIENELRAQSQQITQLNQRPVPQPVNVSPLQDRLAALEKEVQGLSQQSAPAGPQQQADSAALRNRIAALETRLGDVAQQVTQTAGAAGQAGDAAQRAIAQAQQATAQAQQAADAAKQAAAQASAAAQDANRAVQSAGRADRVQQAIAALEAGQPLGQITNAPPALQQFATTPPPTEAQLRLAFPAAAEAAAEASKPRTDNLSLGDRMWLRIRSLVTVRQGDKVVVGSPAITVLDAARAKLNAGDLAGAVAELDRLDGAAAQAMADWLGQAKSLLAARAALVSMAHT